MSVTVATAPLQYSPAFEAEEKDESQTAHALTETMCGITDTTFKDTGHAMRSVHAKSHGLLLGHMHVLPNLPS